jgi:hypothetical protein
MTACRLASPETIAMASRLASARPSIDSEEASKVFFQLVERNPKAWENAALNIREMLKTMESYLCFMAKGAEMVYEPESAGFSQRTREKKFTISEDLEIRYHLLPLVCFENFRKPVQNDKEALAVYQHVVSNIMPPEARGAYAPDNKLQYLNYLLNSLAPVASP